VQTDTVFCEDERCRWCCVISGLYPLSVVTCRRNNCPTCFCESQNLQFFLVEIFRVRISSRAPAVLTEVMWISTFLCGKQWGTDKWAWPFINACFLIHHSPSLHLPILWDRPCVWSRAPLINPRIYIFFFIIGLVRKIVKSHCELRHVCTSVRPSAKNNSALTGRIFMKFDVWWFFEKSVEKIQFSLKSNKNNGYFTWRPTYICDHMSFLSFRMKNVSVKSYRENQNTHFVLSNLFSENHAIYEIMWKNIVERGRPQMTIWDMGIACWIPKATNTHTQVV